MNLVRTAVHRDDLRVIYGPSESGVEARRQDRTVATTKKRRFLEGLAEGICTALGEGAVAKVLQGVNGKQPPLMSKRQLKERQKRLQELEERILQYDQAVQEATDAVREAIEVRREKEAREAAALAAEIEANSALERQPDSFHKVDVSRLLEGLADVANGSLQSDALRKLLRGLRPVDIGLLNIRFETELLLPDIDGEIVVIGPFRFTVENTKRHPTGVRPEAMADVCFAKGWPAPVVARGVPLITATFNRQRVASAVSRRLKPHIGGKAASVVAGCEVPEVMAVVSRHLGLGQPEIEVESDLEARIVKTYIEGDPLGPKAWYPDSEAAHVGELLRRIRDYGSVAAETETVARYARWEERGWLRRRGDEYVQQKCRCGSEDLALIPTPEPDGLVCLDCRRDRTGLLIPGSWNTALLDAEYWEAAGKDVSVSPTPGLPDLHTIIEPLTLR